MLTRWVTFISFILVSFFGLVLLRRHWRSGVGSFIANQRLPVSDRFGDATRRANAVSLEGGMILFPPVKVNAAAANHTAGSTHVAPTSVDGGMALFPPVRMAAVTTVEPVPIGPISGQQVQSYDGGMVLFPPVAVNDIGTGIAQEGMVLFPPVMVSPAAPVAAGIAPTITTTTMTTSTTVATTVSTTAGPAIVAAVIPESESKLPWWFWIVLIVVILIFLYGLFVLSVTQYLKRCKKQQEAESEELPLKLDMEKAEETKDDEEEPGLLKQVDDADHDHRNDQMQAESTKYEVLLSPQTKLRCEQYYTALSQGRQEPGERLRQALAEASPQDWRDFLGVLLNTKEVSMFAENAVEGNGSDWNLEELGILGDISIAVPVGVYDSGLHREPQQHLSSFPGTLLFVPGALLRTASRTAPASDWRELADDGKLDPEKYYLLYERRLLPLLKYASDVAAESGQRAFVTVPGIGCGQFAGPFQGELGEQLGVLLRRLLETHSEFLPGLACLYFDPDDEGSVRRELVDCPHGQLLYLERPFTQGNEDKPQLCHPRAYAEEGDDFENCLMFSIVAWDHVSWPGNDFWIGSRATDGGVKAAATDAMWKLTGVQGEYDAASCMYRPPGNYRNWEDVVKSGNLRLSVDCLRILPDEDMEAARHAKAVARAESEAKEAAAKKVAEAAEAEEATRAMEAARLAEELAKAEEERKQKEADLAAEAAAKAAEAEEAARVAREAAQAEEIPKAEAAAKAVKEAEEAAREEAAAKARAEEVAREEAVVAVNAARTAAVSLVMAKQAEAARAEAAAAAAEEAAQAEAVAKAAAEAAKAAEEAAQAEAAAKAAAEAAKAVPLWRWEEDHYRQHLLRHVKPIGCHLAFEEHHRLCAEEQLRAAMEGPSLTALSSSIALAKARAVAKEEVWFAEVYRRRRETVEHLQSLVAPTTEESRKMDFQWRCLWAKKMSVLRDLISRAEKDPNSVLQEIRLLSSESMNS
jgi:hypothetical protein